MRLGPALAITALALGFATRPALPASQGAQLVSQFTWASNDPNIGGLSALAMQDNGRSALALTDRGRLLQLNVDRLGRFLAGIEVVAIADLVLDRQDNSVATDSEGIAVASDGAMFVSFERKHSIRRIDPARSQDSLIETPLEFHSFGRNTGLEALAVNSAGHLYTLPERPSSKQLGFPVWRWNGETWSRPFYLPARDGFRAVSADFGTDGAFYLLERRLTFLGFQSRLRRWDIAGDAAVNETVLITTRAGEFGNLEGLSLWYDSAGQMRATMVTDNNFQPVMRMQLVEFSLTE